MQKAASFAAIMGCVWLMPAATTAMAKDALPAPSSAWTGSFMARVEALALLETLNAELLSNSSATASLEHWCGAHHLADPPRIVADRLSGSDKPVTSAQRQELGVGPAETVRYRRVNLRCGSLVLSEADNWYVPARLTAEMNTVLETTDTPFGKAVQALHFQRHTLSSTLLWRPLPDGWEMNAEAVKDDFAAPSLPARVLEHKAVLSTPDGVPFSEVVETYTDKVLGFRPPRAR